MCPTPGRRPPFAPLRPSAVAALILGIGPSAAAMLLTGDFNAQVLGVSMLSIALLMIRFVALQFDQLVTEVQLQHEVHDLANTDAEGDRIANLLGNKSIMMMGNHGILIAAASVAEAFDLSYYLERACRNLALAYQTGQKLHVMTPAVAEKTAQEWECDREQFKSHFAEMKAILAEEDPSFAT